MAKKRRSSKGGKFPKRGHQKTYTQQNERQFNFGDPMSRQGTERFKREKKDRSRASKVREKR